MITGKKMNALVDKLSGALVNLKKFEDTEKKTHYTKATNAIEKVIKDATLLSEAAVAKKNKKPRKLNDYMVYANKVRADVVKRLGPVPVTEVAREIGKMWKLHKETLAPKA